MRAGLGSIIPLQLLTTLSPLEMELRTCGLPYINLEFLKVSDLSQCFLCPSTVLLACGRAVLIPISQLLGPVPRPVTQTSTGTATSAVTVITVISLCPAAITSLLHFVLGLNLP